MFSKRRLCQELPPQEHIEVKEVKKVITPEEFKDIEKVEYTEKNSKPKRASKVVTVLKENNGEKSESNE